MTTEALSDGHIQGVERARQLIEDAGGTGTVAALAARLSGPGCLLLSGSLVDGLGNSRSDLDLYFVADEITGPGVQMALTARSYVDVERLTLDRLRELAARIEQVPVDEWVARTALEDIDLYYRLAIAVPVLSDRCRPVEVSGLDRAASCRALAHWADLSANANAARARLALAAKRPRHAACYAHEAVVLMATAVLARLGDGYPSTKWVEEKVRRTLRLHDDECAQLSRLLAFDLPANDYVASAVAWIDRHSSRSRDAVEVSLVTGASVIPGGPTGTAVAIGRAHYRSVVVEDCAAVRSLCGQPEPEDIAALARLSNRERGSLLTLVAADLQAAGAGDSQVSAS